MKYAREQTAFSAKWFSQRLPARGRLLAIGVIAVLFGAACWVGLASSARRVDAYDDSATTPTPPPLSPEVQEAMANAGGGAAALPASVSSFSDLLALTPSEPASEAYSETGATPSTVTAQSPRPLGEVTVRAGPTPCDGSTCYDIVVSCPQLTQNLESTVKIGEPTGTVSGTILFWSGWTGTYPYDVDGSDGRRGVMDELEAAGYRTVQIIWNTSWWYGAQNQLEGHAKLACRAATVSRWVYDNIHESPDMRYCATGHSNGASEVAYAIAQYGLADIFDAVLFESGPNWARIDYGCIEDSSDPEKQALFYQDLGGRMIINQGLGLGTQGACVDQEESFRPRFEEASLAFDAAWPYSYPNTRLAFVFGEKDLSTTAVHGLYFYTTVVQAGSPMVSVRVAADTDHWLADTPQGTAAIRKALFEECLQRKIEFELYMPLVVK